MTGPRSSGYLVLLYALVQMTPAAAADSPAVIPGSSRAEVLAAAEAAFAEGIALRHDAVRARVAFARAAAGYDELWASGEPTPALAWNRAAAHRLAGDLPRALVALNEGLIAFPWHRPLQAARESARAAVAYPSAGGLVGQCRPPAPAGLGSRVSPGEAWLIAAGLWLGAWGAVARLAMTHARGWAVTAMLLLVVLVGFAYRLGQDRAADRRWAAVVVLARDEVLRTGNATAFPPRLEPALPRGVEARRRAERGGWVQVELAGGAVGWLPAEALLTVPDPTSPRLPRMGSLP